MKKNFKGLSLIVVIMLLMCTSLLSGCVNIILPERQIKTNKLTYYTNEEIFVTAIGDETNWVGVYKVADNIKEVDCIRWYRIDQNNFISGSTYSLQRDAYFNETREEYINFPAGAYKAILFDVENNIKEISPFVVVREKLPTPEAPTKLEYNVFDIDSGLANGEVKVFYQNDSYASDFVLYWANDEGILENHTNLATFRVNGNPTIFIITDIFLAKNFI